MGQPNTILAKMIANRNGFRPLGEISVGLNGGLRFPQPPDCGGLYLIAFKSGGHYVGETGRYARAGSKPGRFNHYASPADDIWTELVIHTMLVAGGGGYIHVREEPLADKSRRKEMEAAVVRDFVGEGIPLWNEGGGRCERTYLAWKIPIIERMLKTAATRYAKRKTLKPYSIERLRNLPITLKAARDEAQRLGSAVTYYDDTPLNRPISSRSRPPSILGRARESQQAVAHRFLAARPDATCDELVSEHRGILTDSTAQTLWRDLRMTLTAMSPGTYQPGENVTLTIRRITCRLWDDDPGSVTKEMVEDELIRQRHFLKPETVRSIAGNTLSTLEAFERQRRPRRLG